MANLPGPSTATFDELLAMSDTVFHELAHISNLPRPDLERMRALSEAAIALADRMDEVAEQKLAGQNSSDHTPEPTPEVNVRSGHRRRTMRRSSRGILG